MNPILSAILSFIIPGLGQALEGDIKRGIIFFVILLILVLLIHTVFGEANWTFILDIIYRLYAGYDAYQLSNN